MSVSGLDLSCLFSGLRTSETVTVRERKRFSSKTRLLVSVEDIRLWERCRRRRRRDLEIRYDTVRVGWDGNDCIFTPNNITLATAVISDRYRQNKEFQT